MRISKVLWGIGLGGGADDRAAALDRGCGAGHDAGLGVRPDDGGSEG
jgi:hypothetical protein